MVELNIYASDISDMDETLDRAFDIRNGWGTEAVSEVAEFQEKNVFHPAVCMRLSKCNKSKLTSL